MRSAYCLIALSMLFCVVGECVCAREILDWAQLPQLPPPPGTEHHWGLAGSFIGIDGDALIMAGGTNLANPVLESDKIWQDEIYVLVKDFSGDHVSYRWVTNFKLDKPIAYGTSVSTVHGVLCMGGSDTERTYSDVFLLRWNKEKEEIEQRTLPALPQPCAYSGAAIVGNKVYVAGGTTQLGLETARKNFWALDLANIGDEELTWQQVLPWPGPSRAFAIVAAQHNGNDDCIYVMSGRRIGEGGEIEFLTDVYEFAPARYNPEKYDSETGT